MNTDKVRVVEPFDTDHTQAYELRSIPMERLHAMPFVMNIIKLRVQHVGRARFHPAPAFAAT